MPSANAFLQGTTFVDANLNGILDPGESYLGGSTITLFRKGNPTAIGVTTSDPLTGYYKFDDGNVVGGLSPGTYDLVETPPAGYRNASAQVLSQINPASVIDSRTIEVTLVDPSSLQITFDSSTFFSRNKWELLSFSFFGNPDSNTVGQYPITVTGTGLGAGGVHFLSLCTDLAHNLSNGTQTYSVFPSPIPPPPADPTKAGQIAYLYNHYGTMDLSEADAVGLQLAIWQLEYGANFTNVAAVDPPTTAAQLAAAQARESFYLADSAGKSEAATFLLLSNNSPTNGQQGMIATSSYNFGNVPKSSPSITTAASATAGGTVGVALLGDTATISGGANPTGTITFTLTAPDQTTILVGSVPVNGNGTYSAPTMVLATQVGTYTWHATYNGDAVNNAATDNGVGESVTTGNVSPSVTPLINTTASVTAGGTVGVARLGDTATISGGLNPTGTLTFTLTAPDHTTFLIGSVPVNGNGTYSAPTMVLATQVGTYTWHATYSGDAVNNPATDNGVGESVTTVNAPPPVVTKKTFLASFKPPVVAPAAAGVGNLRLFVAGGNLNSTPVTPNASRTTGALTAPRGGAKKPAPTPAHVGGLVRLPAPGHHS